MTEGPMSGRSRRDFLKIAVAGAAGTALAPSLGRAADKSVTLLHESSFIKTFDEYMQKTLAPAYEKETGVKVVYELTSVGSLPTRISTITETGSGADVTMIFLLYPFLFADKLMDVSDIAEDIGKKQGGWYDAAKEAGIVNGQWKAVPHSNIGQLMNWRTDWFKEVGVTKFPDTWEELYEVGKKLKAKDHPFGFELGHGFGDNHGWIYPLLWSYGGREVEPDGKTLVIDSDETARAVDFARKFFKDTMLDYVLGWYASADPYYQPFLHAYDNAPTWDVEPRNKPYRDAMGSEHLPGWPAPPTRQLAEVVAKYVTVDMFAKACAGASTKEVIKNAEAQLKEIYRTA